METQKKPYILFLLISALYGIGAIGLLISDNMVQTNSTYFKLENWHLCIFIAMFFFVQWAIYRAFSKYLISRLCALLHVIITLIYGAGILLYLMNGGILINYESFNAESGSGYLASFAFPIDSIFVQLSLALFTLAQLIFVLNVLLGIFKYLISKEK